MPKGQLRIARRAECPECSETFLATAATRRLCSEACALARKIRMNRERGKGRCADCGGVKANLYALRCGTCSQAARRRGTCTQAGCERPHAALGLCGFHRSRQHRGISFGDPIRGTSGYRRSETACPVDGCDRVTFSGRTGHCSMHHDRFREHGDVGPAASKRRPPGAWIPWQVDKHGYVRRREGGKWVTQHRVVMEQLIGRPLLAHESVHHVNGDRADNRLTNLELWSKAQPAGQRVTDKVAWAIELIQTYAPEALADRPVQLKLLA